MTAIQNRYSMMARWHEALFPVLEELNVGLVAFSPMANGLLTGKYDQNSRFEAGTDYRGVMPQFAPEAFEQNRALLELIHSTAQRKNATPAQISLAWMLCKKPWIVPIPGSRKVERLKENAGAAEIELSAAEAAELDRALDGMEMSQVFASANRPVRKPELLCPNRRRSPTPILSVSKRREMPFHPQRMSILVLP